LEHIIEEFMEDPKSLEAKNWEEETKGEGVRIQAKYQSSSKFL
jgi:hypothetical protein